MISQWRGFKARVHRGSTMSHLAPILKASLSPAFPLNCLSRNFHILSEFLSSWGQVGQAAVGFLLA